MNKREIKVLVHALDLISRVNQPLNSPKLHKLERDLADFTEVAAQLESVMKPLPNRRLTVRKEQV